MKVIQVICQNNDWPCVDAELPYSTSKAEDLVTFMAIFSNIDMTIHCRIMAFLLLIRYVTLWPWPFDLEQLSHMVGLVTNPAAKLDTIENAYAAVAATVHLPNHVISE